MSLFHHLPTRVSCALPDAAGITPAVQSASPAASSSPPAPRCRMCGCADLCPAGTVIGHTYLRCARCRFVFAPRASPQRVRPLYSSGYRGPHGGAPDRGWAIDTSFLDPAFDLLDREQQHHREREARRILDFGAGDSITPDLLRRRGHRVTAVDLAPPARPHRDRLTGDLLNMNLAPARFDLIYSYQVFEHLPAPAPILRELRRLTRPGGLILIHTDMEMPEREAGLERWWYVMPPDHCCFYRHRTFELFVRDTPDELVFADPKRVIIRRAGGDARRTVH